MLGVGAPSSIQSRIHPLYIGPKPQGAITFCLLKLGFRQGGMEPGSRGPGWGWDEEGKGAKSRLGKDGDAPRVPDAPPELCQR